MLEKPEKLKTSLKDFRQVDEPNSSETRSQVVGLIIVMVVLAYSAGRADGGRLAEKETHQLVTGITDRIDQLERKVFDSHGCRNGAEQ